MDVSQITPSTIRSFASGSLTTTWPLGAGKSLTESASITSSSRGWHARCACVPQCVDGPLESSVHIHSARTWSQSGSRLQRLRVHADTVCCRGFDLSGVGKELQAQRHVRSGAGREVLSDFSWLAVVVGEPDLCEHNGVSLSQAALLCCAVGEIGRADGHRLDGEAFRPASHSRIMGCCGTLPT